MEKKANFASGDAQVDSWITEDVPTVQNTTIAAAEEAAAKNPVDDLLNPH